MEVDDTEDNDAELIKICVAPDGHIGPESLRYLQEADFDTGHFGSASSSREGTYLCESGIQLVEAKGGEIAWLVNARIVDMGISGSERTLESYRNVVELVDLKFGQITLELGVRSSWGDVNNLEDLFVRFEGGRLRIPTEHPGIVSEWLYHHPDYRKRWDIPPTMVTRYRHTEAGSPVELWLSQGKTEVKGQLFDGCVVDIVGTGKSMKDNGLKRIEVLDSYISARLIAGLHVTGDPEKWERVLSVAQRLATVTESEVRPVNPD